MLSDIEPPRKVIQCTTRSVRTETRPQNFFPFETFFNTNSKTIGYESQTDTNQKILDL